LPESYLADQPFGQVPVYKEDGVTLFESGAILIHIGEKAEHLLPRDVEGRGRAISWLIAALNSVEPPIQTLVVIDVFGESKDWHEGAKAAALPFAEKQVAYLSRWLGDREWLESRFTIGDLAMIHVLRDAEELIEPHPNLVAYVGRGTSRPAFQRALAAHLEDCAVGELQPV
jgi:glutathione S-transferase